MTSPHVPAPPPRVRAAVLVALAWVACVVAASGFISLLTDREVVPVAAAGPLAAPAGIAAGAVLLTVLGSARTPGRLLPVTCGLAAWIAFLAGSALVALLDGGAGTAVRLLLRSAGGPFALAAAVLGAAAGVVLLLLDRARRQGAGRPRWPWEGDP